MTMRIAVLAVLLVGCSGGDDDSDDGERTYAERACLEIADAVATYDERCKGARYSESYDEILRVVACGDCDNIVAIRDRDEFEGQCVPWFEGMNCDRWNEITEPGELDSSCEDQLQRSLFGDCP